jgi:hypothetical protein
MFFILVSVSVSFARFGLRLFWFAPRNGLVMTAALRPFRLLSPSWFSFAFVVYFNLLSFFRPPMVCHNRHVLTISCLFCCFSWHEWIMRLFFFVLILYFLSSKKAILFLKIYLFSSFVTNCVIYDTT